ncbi:MULTISPECIES: ABC transporter ATP-binding protein [unclassified Aeromicrobium]|uniref:energy-coupling factor ABC transporter ATP-binding protein n=1 Tax=unclassified Aeromicrobium TaxID=2633570 RepID=UPI002889A040|nr:MULTISPECIES: ABC transporter ATP-binding protein [unclassified Aeromicrobium]
MSHRALQAVDVEAHYTRGNPVLRGASLNVLPGRRLALLGANGSGKSTLLSCLAGSHRPQAGEVRLDDVPLQYTRRELRHHRQEVQLVLQDPDDQLFSADVSQDVSFGPINLGLPEFQVRDRVGEALDLLNLVHLRRTPTHRLSFGEKKRVALAGAMAMRPCVLLLDEPTAGLDPWGVEEMVTAMQRLEQAQTTIVVATHDLAFALEWADDVAIMREGTVVTGEAVRMLADESLLDAARLRAPWPLRLAAELAHDGLVPAGSRPRTVAEVMDLLRQHRLTPEASVDVPRHIRSTGP